MSSLPPDVTPLGAAAAGWVLVVVLALLAAGVATFEAARRGLAPGRALGFGGVILAGEVLLGGAIIGLGLPGPLAQGGTLLFRSIFALPQRGPDCEELPGWRPGWRRD